MREFNGLDMKIGDIEKDSLQTFGQYKKMDIVVRFVYAEKVYLTVIEDKTYSNPHDNQLIKYYKTMQKKETIKYFTKEIPKSFTYDKEAPEINKVFYKTSIKYDIDLEACKDEKAGGWKPYFITEIAKLLEEFHDTGNPILDNYLEHIQKLKVLNTEIPYNLPMTEWVNLCKNEFPTFKLFFLKLLSETDEQIRKNTYLTDASFVASFILEYFFPNTPYMMELEVMSDRREDNKKFHLLVRFKEIANRKAKIPDTKLKKKIREQFVALTKNYFQKATDRKNAYAIANGENEEEMLKYGNTPEEIQAIADYIKQVLTVFFSACQKIKIDSD